MAHTPSQIVLLDFASQSSPYLLSSSGDEYLRNIVRVYGDEEPYSDPVVYEGMYNVFRRGTHRRIYISYAHRY